MTPSDPTRPRTTKGLALAGALRKSRSMPDPEVDWSAWIAAIEDEAAALSTTPAHSCDCDEHERTVGGLQSRLAEMEGAFNECMTRLAALSATPAPLDLDAMEALEADLVTLIKYVERPFQGQNSLTAVEEVNRVMVRHARQLLDSLRFANMDYRGNPSQEQEVARTALRTYRRDRIYGKTP